MTRERFRPAGHDHDHFLLTSVVGSYPQPKWLERVRDLPDEDADFTADDVHEAEDDACRAVLKTLEHAGLDVVTDGEMRRDGMVDYFTRFIDGYELSDDDGGGGWNQNMPSVVDTLSSDGPWLVDDYRFAAGIADRPVKMTVTGPFTLASFSDMQAYDSVPDLAYAFADLVAAEAGRLAEAGVPWIQIDEPALGMSPHDELANECLSRIAAEVPDDTRLGLHVCSGNYRNLVPGMFDFPVDEIDLEFASDDADDPAEVFGDADVPMDVGFGVVASSSKEVETVEEAAENIRTALEHVPPEKLTLTPDCGMKPLTRDVAQAKVETLAAAARQVEAELDAGEL